LRKLTSQLPFSKKAYWVSEQSFSYFLFWTKKPKQQLSPPPPQNNPEQNPTNQPKPKTKQKNNPKTPKPTNQSPQNPTNVYVLETGGEKTVRNFMSLFIIMILQFTF